MGRRHPANPPAFFFIFIFSGIANRTSATGQYDFIVTVIQIIIGPTVSEYAVGHILWLGDINHLGELNLDRICIKLRDCVDLRFDKNPFDL